MGLLSALQAGLRRTRESIANELSAILGSGRLTEAMLEELEEQLLKADVGVDAALRMVDALRDRALGQNVGKENALEILREVAAEMLPEPSPQKFVVPLHIVLVIGVNGAGKTTTIGKLAARWKAEGRKVMVAAGDTFRAAAVEQLEGWAERAGVDLVRHHEGADSAAVVYDACSAAKARGHDTLIIDTAGRLHNKAHLMEELSKIGRIIRKHDLTAPHETLLVLDGNTGQNAAAQTRRFNVDLPLTGLVVTKLDGTAKGGSVIAVAQELKVPVRWLGTGEKLEDLEPFSKQSYLEGLFSTQWEG
jgi:fused signal recognition particle receptor